jgi:hypothetical protein
LLLTFLNTRESDGHFSLKGDTVRRRYPSQQDWTRVGGSTTAPFGAGTSMRASSVSLSFSGSPRLERSFFSSPRSNGISTSPTIPSRSTNGPWSMRKCRQPSPPFPVLLWMPTNCPHGPSTASIRITWTNSFGADPEAAAQEAEGRLDPLELPQTRCGAGTSEDI